MRPGIGPSYPSASCTPGLVAPTFHPTTLLPGATASRRAHLVLSGIGLIPVYRKQVSGQVDRLGSQPGLRQHAPRTSIRLVRHRIFLPKCVELPGVTFLVQLP